MKLYIVKPGDCLSVIAQRFHLSWAQLLNWNSHFIWPRCPDLTYPGERIVVGLEP